MAFKQPRVPQIREGEPPAQYLRELALFLKDFSLESWTQSLRLSEEINRIKKRLDEAG